MALSLDADALRVMLGESLREGCAMDRRDLTRREFLVRAAAGTAAIGLVGVAGAANLEETSVPASAAAVGAGKMPLRKFGKTGLEVSLLGFGGGSRFLTASEETASALIERALELGINYFDTASSYGKERASEKRYGTVLPKHRSKIILATKTGDRSYDGAMRSVEESLKHLKTEHLDLIQMHAVGKADEPEKWDKPDGALTALRKLRDQKVVRFVGFTGHESADVHKKIIDSLEFDTVLMALNAADHKAFGEVALPAAVKKDMGIVAMKTTRGLVGTGDGKAKASELLQWAFDLPVATVIVGMETLEVLDENVQLAKAHKPGASERSGLTARLQPHVTAEQLVWAVPGYQDRYDV
jgi:uncharacterized protein